MRKFLSRIYYYDEKIHSNHILLDLTLSNDYFDNNLLKNYINKSLIYPIMVNDKEKNKNSYDFLVINNAIILHNDYSRFIHFIKEENIKNIIFEYVFYCEFEKKYSLVELDYNNAYWINDNGIILEEIFKSKIPIFIDGFCNDLTYLKAKNKKKILDEKIINFHKQIIYFTNKYELTNYPFNTFCYDTNKKRFMNFNDETIKNFLKEYNRTQQKTNNYVFY